MPGEAPPGETLLPRNSITFAKARALDQPIPQRRPPSMAKINDPRPKEWVEDPQDLKTLISDHLRVVVPHGRASPRGGAARTGAFPSDGTGRPLHFRMLACLVHLWGAGLTSSCSNRVFQCSDPPRHPDRAVSGSRPSSRLQLSFRGEEADHNAATACGARPCERVTAHHRADM